MSWLIEHFQMVIFAIVAISIGRTLKRALKQATDEQAAPPPTTRPAFNQDPEDDARVRKIQDEIRRKIAERRGGQPAAPLEPLAPLTPSDDSDETPAPTPKRTFELPPVLPRRVSPTDAFGGPTKRFLDEMERRAQPTLTRYTADEETAQAASASLTRQEDLAEKMRELEEARIIATRRAAQFAASQLAEVNSSEGQLATARGNLRSELRDPQSLRRAFVLREVLGTPVGLR